jgi:hypothetical protein
MKDETSVSKFGNNNKNKKNFSPKEKASIESI